MILSDFPDKKTEPCRAHPTDRLNSLLLDLLILSPFFQFTVSLIWKKIDFLNLTSPHSAEALILWIVMLAMILTGSIAFQTLCWSFFAATPGQYFMKLRVQSDRNQDSRLPWTQSLVRSLSFHFSFVLLALPFLEVMSHPERRTLYDRASETQVVSLKFESDRGPHPLESHFVRQIFLVVAILFSVWAVFGIGHFYQWALNADFKKDEMIEDNYLCAQVSENSQNRVDEALALFMTKAVDEDCLQKESDFALWTLDSEKRSWGSLGRAFLDLADSDKSNRYLQKSCDENSQSESCQIAKAFLGQEARHQIKGFSLTAQVLEFESLEKQGRYADLGEKIRNSAPDVLSSSLVGYLLRSSWATHEHQQARGIYEALSLTQAQEQRQDSTAWLCQQEMENSCESSARALACRELRSLPASNQVDIAWSQLKLKKCRGSDLPKIADYAELFERRPDFKNLVEVSDPQSKLNREQKRRRLQEIAKTSTWSIRKLALSEWLDISETEKELMQIQKYLADHHQHAWAWEQLVVKTIAKAKSQKQTQVLQLASKLIGNPSKDRRPANAESP